jgi:hypothetical protein
MKPSNCLSTSNFGLKTSAPLGPVLQTFWLNKLDRILTRVVFFRLEHLSTRVGYKPCLQQNFLYLFLQFETL